MCGGRNLADGDETMFVDRFTNEKDFAAALYEGGITGVAQDDDDQDDYNKIKMPTQMKTYTNLLE